MLVIVRFTQHLDCLMFIIDMIREIFTENVTMQCDFLVSECACLLPMRATLYGIYIAFSSIDTL